MFVYSQPPSSYTHILVEHRRRLTDVTPLHRQIPTYFSIQLVRIVGNDIAIVASHQEDFMTPKVAYDCERNWNQLCSEQDRDSDVCLTHVVNGMWFARIDVPPSFNTLFALWQNKLDVWGPR